MAGKHTSRVVLNRAFFDELAVAEADALFDVCERVLEVVRVPDAPPYGKGLQEGGAAIAYVARKKVNGTTIGGKQVKKPRDLKLTSHQLDVAAAVGFGFPGRFVELGTLHTPAQPFLTPAVMSVVGAEAEVILSKSISRRLAGMRDKRAAARFGR
jgi:hypothetical protein